MFASSAFAGGEGEGSGADPDKVYELKLGLLHPPSHPNTQGAEHFASLVSERTGGKVKISVFPSSQLGSEKDMFDALSLGTLDFAILGFGDPAKQFPPFLLFDAPFVAKNREHMMRIVDSELMDDLFNQMREKTNVRGLGSFYYGTRHLTTADKAVRGPADIKGLKIRVPDQEIYVATLKNMGANATPMAFSEVYLALQQGVIDGQENPAATIAANKFHEVQKYLSKTSHIIGVNSIYMSDAIYQKIPAEYQDIILKSGDEAAKWITDLAFEKEDEFLGVIADNGVTIVEDVDADAFITQAQELHTKYESRWGVGLLDKVRNIK